MNYFISSRSSDLKADSAEAIISGLAPDGGLFCPQTISPICDFEALASLNYIDLSAALIQHIFPDFSPEEIRSDCEKAYLHNFDTSEVTPLFDADGTYFLELWHGPTCAFKDVALTLLPKLLKRSYAKKDIQKDIVILTATSGDTGKAALEGFKDEEHVFIKVLYPHRMVSLMQERQMVTTGGNNTEVLAVEGNFDDCQRIVKELMEHPHNYRNLQLSSANSINIGRLAPQIVYYFKAYFDLCKANRISFGESIDFVVPTGNFGDVLAGYYAKCMGLPVHQLIVASNTNNVLEDFLTKGVYDSRRPFYNTTSPSIDILVSSNLERLLYLITQDPLKVKGYMEELKQSGSYKVDEDILKKIQKDFVGYHASEAEVKEAIREVYETKHYLMDPHTAVAYCCYQKHADHTHAAVILSTASPYKFPAAVYESISKMKTEDDLFTMDRLKELTGIAIPKPLARLREKEIRFTEVLKKEEASSSILKKLEVMDHDHC